MSDKFVNLHVHSYKSLLDGMIRPDELAKKLVDLGQDTAVVTDHGNLYSLPDLKPVCKANNLKQIVAFEAYTVPDCTVKGSKSSSEDKNESEQNSKRNHLIMWARNNEGYKRLSKICSYGFSRGFYYRPRIDYKILEEVGTDGIMASSACLAGSIDQYLLHDDYENARKETIYLNNLFKDGFWLELQPTEMEEQVKVNKGLIELHKELGIPCIITTDAHYLNKEDKPTHDVLLCMQSKSTMQDEDRWSFHGNSYYVMGRQEILDFFKRNGHETLDQRVIEEAADQTVEVANKCNVHFEEGKHYLPQVKIPETQEFLDFADRWHKKYGGEKNENADYLRYLCTKSLLAKGLVSKKYEDRLNYELSVINGMGFPGYFLVYYDIIRFCHDQKIGVGPGRGCGTSKNLILTNKGRIPINDVRVGDYAFINNEYHEVVDRHSYDINEPVITLTTESNNFIEMTTDHKIFAVKKEDFEKGIREPKWYAMKDLEPGDYVVKGNN